MCASRRTFWREGRFPAPHNKAMRSEPATPQPWLEPAPQGKSADFYAGTNADFRADAGADFSAGNTAGDRAGGTAGGFAGKHAGNHADL